MNTDDKSITITMIMELQHANHYGNVHGGEIMRLMDTTAGCAAARFSKHNAVTARVDELQFLKPIHIGDFVTSTGAIVYSGTTSLEIRVTVDTENLSGDLGRERAIEAYFTLVALDEDERPTPVPRYTPETEREKELYEYAKARRAQGRERREAYKLAHSKPE